MKIKLKQNSIKLLLVLFVFASAISCRETVKENTESVEGLALLDDNATVTYKFSADQTILREFVTITIGGNKVNLNSDKVSGVNIFSSGEIFTNVTVKQGFGNYKLELTKVVTSSDGKTYKTTPSPSENVHVRDGINVSKNLVFNLKE